MTVAVDDDWCEVTGYEDDLETHELDELARDRELDFDNGCPCCGDPDGFDGDD